MFVSWSNTSIFVYEGFLPITQFVGFAFCDVPVLAILTPFIVSYT